jgi:serine/threonine-protein kinase
MDYVEGPTCSEEVQRLGSLDWRKAVEIAGQVAEGLEFAASKGVIHRDVTPGNIIIDSDGTARITDLGLAKETTADATGLTRSGASLGTPYYMSPEQINSARDVDYRTDIYSLGATLYHLVTGRVPFEAPTPAAVMHKHLKEPLIPPDHLNTKLSAGIGEVVEVMMAKDRNRRYASTTDLLLDLEAIAKGESPLQARKRIDSGLLSGLTQDAREDTAQLPPEPAPRGDNMVLYIVLLAAGLALSIIANIFLLLR